MKLKALLFAAIFLPILLSACNNEAKRAEDIKNACAELGLTTRIQYSTRVDILKGYNYTPLQAQKMEFYYGLIFELNNNIGKHSGLEFMEEPFKNALSVLPTCEEMLTELDKGEESYQLYYKEWIKDFNEALESK